MNIPYDNALDLFANGDIDWTNDSINVVIVGPNYSPDIVNHKFLSDVPEVERLTFAPLNNKSTDGRGVLDAEDTIVSGVVSEKQAHFLIIYKESGSASTSPLLFLISDAQGLPLNLSGQNIPINWPDDPNKIFSFVDRS